jgi:hypothetical protein
MYNKLLISYWEAGSLPRMETELLQLSEILKMDYSWKFVVTATILMQGLALADALTAFSAYGM